MPIGKNAIKRVSNNGYSNVKTLAPDMENSTVRENVAEVTAEKKTTAKKAPVKAAPKTESKAPAKTAKRKASPTPKKSMESEPTFSPVKTAERVIEKTAKAEKRQGEGYINLGGELPVHLL